MTVAPKAIWKWLPSPQPPAAWTVPMIELDSAAGESPETSLYQVLSQGKRSAGPPVAPPPAEPQPVVGWLEVVGPASVAVAGGLPPGSSAGACADVQAASKQARSRRVMVGRMSCT